jgi:type I restriction enzyme M protein
MAIRKSAIYGALWKGCDELRGSMDASQYKDYVLTLLFVKYVSDKYAGKRDATIVVPAGASFADMVKLKNDKEIGDKINKHILTPLAQENNLPELRAVDFNDENKLGKGKDLIERLSNLIAIFEDPALNFSKNQADGDDILGDAYEYLMRHFATESGKSKGQFYTPAEVSRIMAKVLGIKEATSSKQTVYDPTCGSGSLLLKAVDEAPVKLAIYGQENDNATAALAKMNMILHDNATAEIWKDNTLSSPHFLENNALKTFDFVVANPPFSTKAWSTGLDPANDRFNRFEYGTPPAKNGDYAFLLHILKSMKSTGKGAVILPHGVLFRGNAEAAIRKNLIERGFIKGIIGLPANLFYGTGIPACIIVLDKEHAAARKGIFMIDASKGFIKDGNKNRLRAQDIHKIVDAFTKQQDVPKYARMVGAHEIASPANDYNLNIPRYIDSGEAEDIHDIAAHLMGGIPVRDVEALTPYWQVFPSLQKALFTDSPRKGYLMPLVKASEVRQTIFNHPEFTQYAHTVNAVFTAWQEHHHALLENMENSGTPKATLEMLAEDLLARFAAVPLLDKYDVYQHLIEYWGEVLYDDVVAIKAEGWKKANSIRLLTDTKNKKDGEQPDFAIGKQKYKADLIPPTLVIARYFSAQQATIQQLEADSEALTAKLEELKEEHTGEDGLLADALSDKGDLTKASVADRLKNKALDADERTLLKQAQEIVNTGAELDKKAKDLEKQLYEQVIQHYARLDVAEIKTLTIRDKWLATLQKRIDAEMQRVTNALANRIKELEERYSTSLPALLTETETLQAKVDGHLKKMGFVW